MSTHAVIAMATKNGYKAIGVNFDGYVGHTGAILGGWYNTEKKVAALIALGNLSQINERLAPDEGEKHSWKEPAEGVTIAYHRDRGEKFRNLGTFATRRELQSNAEYVYVFENGRWFVWGVEADWIELNVTVGDKK